MYKAFIEPDLQTAHIKIINKFNPFSGFQNPTYILKVNLRVLLPAKFIMASHVKSHGYILVSTLYLLSFAAVNKVSDS